MLHNSGRQVWGKCILFCVLFCFGSFREKEAQKHPLSTHLSTHEHGHKQSQGVFCRFSKKIFINDQFSLQPLQILPRQKICPNMNQEKNI